MIQQMTHVVHTIFRDSESSIDKKLLEKPYQGILQGNGAGLITWFLTSTPAVKVLKEQGYGAIITSVLTKEFSKTIGSIFVDDMDLVEGSLNGSLLIIDEIASKL